LFAPVGIQPLKQQGSTASYQDRVAMTELAIQGLAGFAICLEDAPNPEGRPNYTIDTLLRLRKRFPSAALFTLMGADSLRNLPQWHRGEEVPFVAPLIVASRPGEQLEDLTAILPAGLSISEDAEAGQKEMGQAEAEGLLRIFTLRNAAGASTGFYLLPGVEIDISATEVRQQVSAGLDQLCAGHALLSDAVCGYIAAHELYR
jgi:nicotinate-nucleotide adenylyltransferase